MTRAIPLAVALVAACGGAATFRLSGADDNDRAQLHAALARRRLDDRPTPTNRAHEPRVFAVVTGPTTQLVAYDLDRGRARWQVPVELTSRVWVSGDVVIARERGALVARDQDNGGVRWTIAIDGDLVGAAADRDRAYVAWRAGSTKHPRWYVAGYDAATGARLWKLDADGQLGAPAAHGGVVYVPFLAQWLSIVDGATGAQLARLRNTDDQITIVRAGSTAGFFGSRRGVRPLDDRAIDDPRARAVIPPQLDRATYGQDRYDPIELGYTAADRARVLYAGAGPYAIHYFRYVFGFTDAGALAWAYAHPRVELVASAHAGAVIAALSSTGDVVALDAATGAPRFREHLAITGAVVGATFDADGWAPSAAVAASRDPCPASSAAAGRCGSIDAQPVAAVLAGIATDRDARFDRVKELAVGALARVDGAGATPALLAVLADERASSHLKELAADALVARKDPAGLPALVAQLATQTDYIARTEPVALGPVARAIAGLAGQPIERADAALAVAALVAHLDAPTTTRAELAHVIAALAAIGGGSERPALASHLLEYRADELADGEAWCAAIARALAEHDPGGRVLLEHVAADPRTRPTLAAAIREVLTH